MQRQLAIQRLQEQEKERQLRLEQQKQTIQMRAQMPAFSLPYAQVRLLARAPPARTRGRGLRLRFVPQQLQAMPATSGVIYQPSGPTSFPSTFSPAGSVEGSPMHGVYMNQAAQGGSGPYSAMPVAGTGTAGSWSCVVGAERKAGASVSASPQIPAW